MTVTDTRGALDRGRGRLEGRVAGGGSSPGGRGRARRDCDRHTGCLRQGMRVSGRARSTRRG